jgi:outer membrane protein assembly factor BamB
LWRKVVREQLPHAGHHRDHGYASASPTTDGELLIAHFGSFGTYAMTLEGELLWETDLGDMQTRNSFGEGSSPTLHGDRVFVLWDHEEDDFIVALDRKSGKELWRKSRDEPTGWSTPLVVEHDGKTQVIVNGSNRVRSYDATDGRLLWECGGQTVNVIPCLVSEGDLVYAMSGFRGSALVAIRLGGSGDLTGTDAVIWEYNRNTPYVPSPLLHEGLLYFFKGNNPTFSIFAAQDGTAHVNGERLDGLRGVYASPVAAAGHVYLLGRSGGAMVLAAGPKVEVLATNRLDDGFDASPAAVGDALFLRGREFLYCLAEE